MQVISNHLLHCFIIRIVDSLFPFPVKVENIQENFKSFSKKEKELKKINLTMFMIPKETTTKKHVYPH